MLWPVIPGLWEGGLVQGHLFLPPPRGCTHTPGPPHVLNQHCLEAPSWPRAPRGSFGIKHKKETIVESQNGVWQLARWFFRVSYELGVSQTPAISSIGLFVTVSLQEQGVQLGGLLTCLSSGYKSRGQMLLKPNFWMWAIVWILIPIFKKAKTVLWSGRGGAQLSLWHSIVIPFLEFWKLGWGTDWKKRSG